MSILIFVYIWVVIDWHEAEMLNFRPVMSELLEDLICNFGVQQSTLIRRIVIDQQGRIREFDQM